MADCSAVDAVGAAPSPHGEGDGGYDCDFVCPPPADYECPVCLLTLREPQIVDCCGMKFCLSCIELVRDRRKPCPFCKQSFVFMAEKQLKRRIEDLRVYCPQKAEGCEWCGELRDLKTHRTACPFVKVTCSLGCGSLVPRREQQAHELDHCAKRSLETKLYSLAQKLEKRVSFLEERCSQQDKEIVRLKEIIQRQETEMQNVVRQHKEEVAMFKEALDNEVAILHTKQHNLFSTVENELMKRCFSFSIRLGCGELWTSPPFFSHCRGYQLQMLAETGLSLAQGSLEIPLKKSLFQREDRFPIVLSLHILHRKQETKILYWPVYITVDILVLTNSDQRAHGKLHTLVDYRELEDNKASSEMFEHNKCVIGYAERIFDCRILVVRLEHSPEPPSILL